MARIKGPSGGAAYAVALVLVSTFFVFSLVLAILFYSQVSAARIEKTEADEKLKRLATGAEQAQANELVKPEANQTPVGALIKELRYFKQRTVGAATLSQADIESELKAVNVGPEATLLGEVKRLQAEKTAADGRVKLAEDEAKAAREKVARAEEQSAEVVKNFRAAEQALGVKLTELAAERTKAKAEVDGQFKTLASRLEEQQASSKKAADELRNQVAKAESDRATMEKRNAEIVSQIGVRGTQVDPTRQVDGKVVSVEGEDRLVYIDLGRVNHLPVGITFEVFDRSAQVEVSGGKRGKATIEVTNVSENSATARVVRQDKGKQIIEGDQLANLVYDPNITYRFVVHGDFDIDNVGRATEDDRTRIVTMITEWGGKVDAKTDAKNESHVSYDVDFLVLGQEPRLPEPLKPDVIDPRVIAEFAAKKKAFDNYQTLLAEARALSVPVLNQNRFLNLVGYYRR